MNLLIPFKTRTLLLIIPLALACFGLSPTGKANPDPSGTFSNGNTADGGNALFSVISGGANTAIGNGALFDDTTGGYNTAVGVEALGSNIDGSNNTAVGVQALSVNTADNNTATGYQALFFNNTGSRNTATGENALHANTTGTFNTATGGEALINNNGNDNTATGFEALFSNTSGFGNTANGFSALFHNSTGSNNTAEGLYALFNNIGGIDNTAVGYQALLNNKSNYNTAVGLGALLNVNGNSNVGIGVNAGSALTIGNGNVCIGYNVFGVAPESNTTRIRNVYSSVASGRAVYVTSGNKIGTLSSSRRYKEEIKPMDKASETLFALKPVTFRYKKEVDAERALSFGLIAEDVAKISPDLITRDEKGNPQTVRYEAVNAMLLNEFLKEHRKVQQLQADAAQTRKQVEALTASLQKVSAQLEVTKSAPQTALNNQ